jgi:GDP-mannose pyrophosphatase NudK
MSNRIKNLEVELVAKNWYVLKKASYEYQKKDGSWEKQNREAYDRGNGAGILLYNKTQGTVILTEQFRLPTYINGNDSGMMIEVCAGQLDKDNPEDCVRRETEEETGYRVGEVKKVLEAYMSPGSVTEILYLFIAEYDSTMKVTEGGGVAHEQENIEVLELPFQRALDMIVSGEIRDAKTIMLLQYAKLQNLM